MRAAAVWGAGLLLAGVGVVIGFRAADADGVTPVPQLLAFLPWLLLPGALALLVALLARWRAGVLWTVVVLALTAWFVRPYEGPAGAAGGAEAARFTVLTSNVEFGRATDGLVAAVERERPDLVFVQECEFTCADVLARRLSAARYPYRNVVAAGGSEGSAILSRFPLTPTAGIAGTLAMPGAVARIGGRDVAVQLAHPLPPIPGGVGNWRRELGAVREFAARSEGPTVLAGDFNASQDHAAFRALLDTGLRDAAATAGRGREPSWPSRTAPPLGAQIDHVLVGADLSVRGARFVDLADTDHRSLLAELTLHEG
ncbi:endonuclease/exonuclease/phosphatase family protein [Streptomyces sp. NPDC060194]|uniref:endonuclease/exonuclease/phosphatase family protein n=1 Tax=Streptomyces sp. NPDC060194 TaxID=3347069 RepID=UPI00366A237F